MCKCVYVIRKQQKFVLSSSVLNECLWVDGNDDDDDDDNNSGQTERVWPSTITLRGSAWFYLVPLQAYHTNTLQNYNTSYENNSN